MGYFKKHYWTVKNSVVIINGFKRENKRVYKSKYKTDKYEYNIFMFANKK